jgi:hypothetical protein|tara:strand:- start:421 stop:609 length:189 start_codon:yes stop_codon:yes gene_type:complete
VPISTSKNILEQKNQNPKTSKIKIDRLKKLKITIKNILEQARPSPKREIVVAPDLDVQYITI